MGFGNDLLSSAFKGAAQEIAKSINESMAQDIEKIQEVLELLMFNFAAVHMQKVKPRKDNSFYPYMRDVLRVFGMCGDLELYELAGDAGGSAINMLSVDEAECHYKELCGVLSALKVLYINFGIRFELEYKDLKSFLKNQAKKIDRILSENISKRKMYKCCQYIILETNAYIKQVISDLDEMLSFIYSN